MDALGTARLTEAQRASRLHFMQRKTAKQIAIERRRPQTHARADRRRAPARRPDRRSRGYL